MVVLSYLFIVPLVGAFLSDPDAFAYGVSFSRIMLCTSFLAGIYCVLNNALQGFGSAVASLIVNISRQGIVYIPALFIMKDIYGMMGLVWAQPIADILSYTLTIVLYLVVSGKRAKEYQRRTQELS